ncbi:MAG: hypothetical protein KatS3mg125_0941 [Lysobacterales bacterium]|jgi:hypothetical protein|nr:MAG: hypothetical protein KatS3mg125_0941 [Xanthomonadales bacterium]
MRKVRRVVFGILATSLALLAIGLVFAFFLSGGFERWRAEREVAERGFEATEQIDIDGIFRMRIPRGWRRDLAREALSGDAPYAEEGGVRSGPRLANPEFARAFLVLGRYSDASGWPRMSAEAEVQVPTPDALPWEPNPPQRPPGIPIWRGHQREEEGVVYVDALVSAQELERAPQVLFHARRSGVRVMLRSAPGVYSLEQAIAIAREMALSIEPDPAVMARLLEEYRARAADKLAAAERSRALVREHFGIETIALRWDPAQLLPEGSFLQSTKDTVKLVYRLGELPRSTGEDPERALARYRLQSEGLDPALLARLPLAADGRPRLRIFAVWKAADGGMAFADLDRREPRGYHDPSIALTRALVPTLREDALAIFWIEDFSWTETARIAAMLATSQAIRQAAEAGRPPWVRRTPP